MEIALRVCILKNSTANLTDFYLDIFIVCDDNHTGNKFFQIWVNNKDAGFTLAQTGNLPSGVQAISFADIGTIHLCISFCFRIDM
jgi:integrin alpha FG-GAP repeat containing protein 1